MTCNAQRYYIKPVVRIVTTIMMIVLCWLRTLTARTVAYMGQESTPDCLPDSFMCFRPLRVNTAPFSAMYAVAYSTAFALAVLVYVFFDTFFDFRLIDSLLLALLALATMAVWDRGVPIESVQWQYIVAFRTLLMGTCAKFFKSFLSPKKRLLSSFVASTFPGSQGCRRSSVAFPYSFTMLRRTIHFAVGTATLFTGRCKATFEIAVFVKLARRKLSLAFAALLGYCSLIHDFSFAEVVAKASTKRRKRMGWPALYPFLTDSRCGVKMLSLGE